MRPLVTASLAVAAASGAALVAVAIDDPRRAAFAWLAAFGWGVSAALGALTLVMIFHVTGARWSLVFHPILTSIAATLPLFALFFVPVVVAMRVLYPWAGDLARFDEPIRHAIQHQRAWNNPGFFVARAALYLATWSVLGLAVRRAHLAHERDPSPARLARQRAISAVGLPVVAFTLCFASFDWLMSVEAGWSANMYGLFVFASGLSAALAILAVAGFMARRAGVLAEGTSSDHFHALGRLLLMSVVFWAYIAFFMLMLVWIANLPREVTFFVSRAWATSPGEALPILTVRLFVPFFLLLSRPLKRRPDALAAVGAWMIVMTAVDFVWLVMPSGVASIHLLDASPFLVVAGLWSAAFGLVFRRAEATSRLDPALAESLRYHSS
ncbi:MAG: hypothetical protein KF819_12665 [Labilithrix sp.]|nr:hypothetical protein [Labilithrix sp.]